MDSASKAGCSGRQQEMSAIRSRSAKLNFHHKKQPDSVGREDWMRLGAGGGGEYFYFHKKRNSLKCHANALLGDCPSNPNIAKLPGQGKFKGSKQGRS